MLLQAEATSDSMQSPSSVALHKRPTCTGGLAVALPEGTCLQIPATSQNT